jgi:hypothetical protein
VVADAHSKSASALTGAFASMMQCPLRQAAPATHNTAHPRTGSLVAANMIGRENFQLD